MLVQACTLRQEHATPALCLTAVHALWLDVLLTCITLPEYAATCSALPALGSQDCTGRLLADVVEIKHIMLPPSRDYKDIYVVFELLETDLHQVRKKDRQHWIGGRWGWCTSGDWPE